MGQFSDSLLVEIQSANLCLHPKEHRIEGRDPISAPDIENAPRFLKEWMYLSEESEREYEHSHTKVRFRPKSFVSKKREQEEGIFNFLHHGNIGKKDKEVRIFREEESESCSDLLRFDLVHTDR